MIAVWCLISFFVCIEYVLCRDFYIGMFKRNDFLVAQDVIFKEASHFGCATASYGRFFKCPITYFRVADRLGMGSGPYTTIVRGGLRKKYISVRIKSTYNLPLSVNIYVGCQNKEPHTIRRLTRPTTEKSNASADESSAGNASDTNGTDKGEGPKGTEPGGGGTSTLAPEGGE